MDLSHLNWQQPAPWEDCEPRLWLRDNLASFDEMSEYVFETEEFKQTRQAVDNAINSASYSNYPLECAPSFEEWLWNNGGCYIQDFEAQRVLAWAIREELSQYGYTVDDSGYPPKIISMQ